MLQKIHPLDDALIHIQIPEMIYIRYILQELIGTNEERKWKIMECLNCSSVVHGVCEENNQLLFNGKFVVCSVGFCSIESCIIYLLMLLLNIYLVENGI